MFALGAGGHFVVASLAIEYRRSARMDDLLEIATALDAMSGASMTLRQAAARGPETLVTATVRLAFLAAGRPSRIPDAVRQALTSR